MENPKPIMEQQSQVVPQILSPSSSGRRSTSTSTSSFSNSPEFEFWMLRNPSNFPQSNLLSSADQLFSGGFLLPLYPQPPNPETTTNPNPEEEEEDPPQICKPDPGPQLSSSTTTLTPSKRWTDIFKKSDKKSEDNNKDKNNKKKERRGNGASSAELNINIWPFSRSRSAGSRPPRMVSASTTARKVSSAPCSRSNSAGESKSRKWPASPARGGVHLGRNSPVWQVRRGAGVHSKAPLAAGGGGRAKVLNLNVPMCIGYRNHLSCKSDVINSAVVVKAGDTGVAAAQNGGVGSGDGGRGGNIFNLRSLFSRKVY
ncbi:hypothetical protein LguiA_025423 [Lonicera macranthoides]